MKKIALISTGGTIASKVDPITGKLLSGKQTGEELLSKCNLENFGQDVSITVKSLLQIPSNLMSFEKNVYLCNVFEQMAREGYEGFVVTHGTDTLEESSYFVSLLWDSDIPIVFTGSQFGPSDNNTDAFHNISNALLVASTEESKGLGVLVSFNDRIFSPQYVTKLHASNVDGFGSPRSGPLGIVDYSKVHYFQKSINRQYYSIKSEELPKVEIIKQYIDMDEGIVDYYISRGTKGLIIEGYGRGHVNPKVADRIKYAIEQGIVVVITTTCIDGEIAPVYLFEGSLNDLLSMGAINGHDYMPKKARIKLMMLLANGTNKDEIQIEFDKY